MKEYVLILPCSKDKNGDYASYNNKKIHFVANPDAIEINGGVAVRPDEKINGVCWNELIKNKELDNMLPAYKLYKNKTYEELHSKLKDRFYIYSAGWGVVNSEIKLPKYDITFSKNKKEQNKYAITDKPLNNWKMLPDDVGTPIVIAAGEDYIKHFIHLTRNISNRKIIIHNLSNINKYRSKNFEYVKWGYNNAKTNWYYSIKDVLNGKALNNVNDLIEKIKQPKIG